MEENDKDQGGVSVSTDTSSRSHKNLYTGIGLAGFVIGMLALAYAAVPLYRMFCQLTGYGGTTQRVEAASDKILDQMIRVRFDANSSNRAEWIFKPEVQFVDIKIGQTVLVNYKAKNGSDHTLTGTAGFNVTPDRAGIYFHKIACFCFEEQTLKAHEEVDMPVTFYVDPKIVDDKDSKTIKEITLSYTFYVNEPKEDQAQ